MGIRIADKTKLASMSQAQVLASQLLSSSIAAI